MSTRRAAPGFPGVRPGRTARDAGFSMVEVLVALVLFAIMSTALISMIVRASAVTNEDARRVVATNLANREIEIARDIFYATTRGPDRLSENAVTNPSPLPGGTAGQDLVVDGGKYTVTRTGRWDSIGSSYASVCDNTSGDLGIFRLQVQVKWAGLGSRPGVVLTTVLTPPKATYTDTDGHIGLKVIDRNAQPRAGVLVQVSGPESASGTTASDGCVLISHLRPGNYTVKLSSLGSVNPAGDSSATTTATVQQGQLWRGTVEYDVAATLTVAFTTQPGYSLPPATNTIPVTLGASFFLPIGAKAFAGTGNLRTLTNLYPTAAGYEVWAGGCAANDPNQAVPATVATTPGGVSIADVPLAPISITNTSGGTRTVTATQDPDGTCGSGQTVSLGTVAGNSTLKTSLPYGTWKISRGGSGTTTVTLGPILDPLLPILGVLLP